MSASPSEIPGETARLGEELARCLRGEAHLRLAYLFGSRARGEARPASDVDVAVLLDAECVGTPAAVKDALFRLGAVLGRVVPSERLDPVLLNHAPALLRHRVIRDGVLLYARSERERVRFVRRTIGEHQDLEPRLREHTRRRIQRLREGRAHGRSGDILAAARRAARLLGPAPRPR